VSTARWDETWHRLREWTGGQGPSERLSAQLLLADGFSGLDPSHPLGGKDGGKDATCSKGGRPWVMAVFFPRGQQSFSDIKKKFLDDLRGARRNAADGIAFVTNQELTLGERKELHDAADPTLAELYHLERVTALLDTTALASTRKQFLGVDHLNADADAADRVSQLRDEMLAAQKRLESLQTGGDSFCYFMLYHFDMDRSVAQNLAVIRKGEFPLYDVRVRICDMDASTDILDRPWGELNAPADVMFVKWPLRPSLYYRGFFHARNGSWHQDLVLNRAESAGCWLASTRVLDRAGTVVFTHVDAEYERLFGSTTWRQ
jgi:hypothetical protein